MTDLLKLINERHSVRRYKKIPIEAEKIEVIGQYIDTLRRESGLDIRFCENAKAALGGLLLKFIGWTAPPPAYIAFAGEKSPEVEEKCGYYGEKLVLFLQYIGLNTCWVGMFSKTGVKKEIKDNGIITIAVGYGETNGKPHRSKAVEKITDVHNGVNWFKAGIDCALKAPTAVNQQKFFITLENGEPIIKPTGSGPFTFVDLGIVRYHFEVGSGKKCKLAFKSDETL